MNADSMKTPDDGRPILVWFRDDLRASDHPALYHAAAVGVPVLCLFVAEEDGDGGRAPGAAQRWFQHHCLKQLGQTLSKIGGRLDIARGKASEVVPRMAEKHNVQAVYWLRRTTPAGIETDRSLKIHFKSEGIEARSFQGNLLHEPSRLLTGAGGPFKVYSPFWRALEKSGEPRRPYPAPESIDAVSGVEGTIELDNLGLLPERPNWAEGWDNIWPAGEQGARKTLVTFLQNGIHGYADGRDFPSRRNVSRLSPYLRFGAISPYQAWYAVRAAQDGGDVSDRDAGKFLKELAWREFSHHLLFHFPDLGTRNFQNRFDAFPWRSEFSEVLATWKKGLTGYPIVDAGMRELWQTGYMHNRVRMIVASFLIKHLMTDWRHGEAWFWDTLVDGDPANNTASWQWVAGSGADAAPYFRIFNPVLQGEKFDPGGDYIRRYVPEIGNLPDRYLHKPWEAPEEVANKAGVRIGNTYPAPMVDHKHARDRALAAFEKLKKADK